MSPLQVRPAISSLSAYVPGKSIDEIREKYGLATVIKMGSNENPLGASRLVQESLRRHAGMVFRYPHDGNPRLCAAIAAHHGVDAGRVVVSNGSDGVIDLLIRILAEPGTHNLVCFRPCFSIYPIQGKVCGVEVRRQPLNADFSFDFDALLSLVDANTRLAFVTTPDNPTGFCPTLAQMAEFAAKLAQRAPQCLLVVDEAYMDFADDEAGTSFLASGGMPDNVACLRTFSKSYGLAGIRLGYGIMPAHIAEYFHRAQIPFSVNLLAEEAGLAALEDVAFRQLTLECVRAGRVRLADGLRQLGCTVWPTQANFLMFRLPQGAIGAADCFEQLLRRGIIIRPLKSYELPDNLRVSVGNDDENGAFLAAMTDILNGSRA